MKFSPQSLAKVFSQTLIKQGKKGRAHRWFFDLAYLLKVKLKKDAFGAVASAMAKLFAGVGIRRLVKGGKLYHLPGPVKDRRIMSAAVHWLIQGSVSASLNYKLVPVQRLYQELDLLALGQGNSLALKDKFVALIQDNRPFLRFIKRKRRTFRKRKSRRRAKGLRFFSRRYLRKTL